MFSDNLNPKFTRDYAAVPGGREVLEERESLEAPGASPVWRLEGSLGRAIGGLLLTGATLST